MQIFFLQVNQFLTVGNPANPDSDMEQSQSLLKRSKSTKKGKSTQTVFTGSLATNTSCIIFYEDALVEVVNVNEKNPTNTCIWNYFGSEFEHLL